MTDAAPTGKAVVQIYRTSSMLGAANVWDVYANKEPVTVLSNGSYYRYSVDPGRIVYSIRVHLNPANVSLLHAIFGNPPMDVLTLNAEPGQTYFLKFSPFSVKLVQTEKGKAEKEIQSCRLTDKVPKVPHTAAEKEKASKTKGQ